MEVVIGSARTKHKTKNTSTYAVEIKVDLTETGFSVGDRPDLFQEKIQRQRLHPESCKSDCEQQDKTGHNDYHFLKTRTLCFSF
jgi:hypothetical protein